MDENTKIYVNPTGRFVIGGPWRQRPDRPQDHRRHLRRQRPHGGGAFSGKDPTKVDRSAAYAARYVAKNIVAAGLADKCQVQLAYAIGVAHPVSVLVETFGTGKVDDGKLEEAVEKVSTCARPPSSATSICAAPSTASSPLMATWVARTSA